MGFVLLYETKKGDGGYCTVWDSNPRSIRAGSLTSEIFPNKSCPFDRSGNRAKLFCYYPLGFLKNESRWVAVG